MKGFFIILILCLFCGVSIASDDIPVETLETPPQKDSHESEWQPMGGIKYDRIQKLTVSGCIFKSRDHHDGELTRCNHEMWIIQAEVGEGGGKLQAGMGVMYMTGGMVKLSLMQTWKDSDEVEPNQTYVGIEGQFNFFLLNTYLGAYTHVLGDSNDKNPLLTFGIGIGF